MKYIIKKFILIIGIIFGISNTLAVTIQIPDGERNEDINVSNHQIESDEITLFEYINIINSYLWFSIAGLAMFALVYAGILYITSGGDKGKISKANKISVVSIISIFISMISYTLIKIIINLF